MSIMQTVTMNVASRTSGIRQYNIPFNTGAKANSRRPLSTPFVTLGVLGSGKSILLRYRANTLTRSATISQPNTYFLYLLERIQKIYVFRDEGVKILKFLEKYPFLASILVEASYHIREFFPLASIYLTVDTEPEDSESEQLVAFISTDLDPEQAANTLKAFDKKWWLKSLKQTKGKLCITLEFK